MLLAHMKMGARSQFSFVNQYTYFCAHWAKVQDSDAAMIVELLPRIDVHHP